MVDRLLASTDPRRTKSRCSRSTKPSARKRRSATTSDALRSALEHGGLGPDIALRCNRRDGEAARRPASQRRAVIVITDGVDTSSTLSLRMCLVWRARSTCRCTCRRRARASSSIERLAVARRRRLSSLAPGPGDMCVTSTSLAQTDARSNRSWRSCGSSISSRSNRRRVRLASTRHAHHTQRPDRASEERLFRDLPRRRIRKVATMRASQFAVQFTRPV